jgi:heme/copper-type cytochrome/quinol oxidase subunit 3
MLILSEAIFFALLIAAYAYFARIAAQGPNAASSLNVMRTGAFSILLFSSSATVHMAARAMRRGAASAMAEWLLATIALGSAFIAGQVLEYRGLYRAGVRINRNLFATTFFTLTGFHGLHVCVGLIVLTIFCGLAIAGRTKTIALDAFEAAGMYWHFVDGVWVVVFSVVYLWSVA